MAAAHASDFNLLFCRLFLLRRGSLFGFDLFLIRFSVKHDHAADDLNDLRAEQRLQLIRQFARFFRGGFKMNPYFEQFTGVQRVIKL